MENQMKNYTEIIGWSIEDCFPTCNTETLSIFDATQISRESLQESIFKLK